MGKGAGLDPSNSTDRVSRSEREGCEFDSRDGYQNWRSTIRSDLLTLIKSMCWVQLPGAPLDPFQAGKCTQDGSSPSRDQVV